MEVIENKINVSNYITKSNLPSSDYVINPYIGCSHACKYCYASFMKRFTGHSEDWGTFIDIKECETPINTKRLIDKNVFLSSVTDPYNQYEEKYKKTRNILEQLVSVDTHLTISTKSSLVLRDIDLFKQMKDVKVALSINTLDEKFRSDMDRASSIESRIDTLKKLHEEGIYTVLFMSPIFPYVTDYKKIIEETSSFVDEYWFENLNLRGSYKDVILDYIEDNYPEYIFDYKKIFVCNDKTFWINLIHEIEDYCEANNIKYKNYFYHEALVKKEK